VYDAALPTYLTKIGAKKKKEKKKKKHYYK